MKIILKRFPTWKFILAGLPLILAGCSGGLTGLNGASEVSGFVFGTDGQAFSGATVYLRGKAAGAQVFETGKALEVDCGDQGGTITCDNPTEAFCGQTCSCADGSYLVNTTLCASDSLTITVCFADICRDAVLDCTFDAPCSIDLSVPEA